MARLSLIMGELSILGAHRTPRRVSYSVSTPTTRRCAGDAGGTSAVTPLSCFRIARSGGGLCLRGTRRTRSRLVPPLNMPRYTKSEQAAC